MDLLWKSRAYLHWYIAEGMEEMEFVEAMEASTALCSGLEEEGSKETEGQETE